MIALKNHHKRGNKHKVKNLSRLLAVIVAMVMLMGSSPVRAEVNNESQENSEGTAAGTEGKTNNLELGIVGTKRHLVYGSGNPYYVEGSSETKEHPVYGPGNPYYVEGPLGTLGGFHLVGFTEVTTNAHTNGNIATPLLHYISNFGTNHVNEISYIQRFDENSPSSLTCGSSDSSSVLVVGKDTTVGVESEEWTVDGKKLNYPNKSKGELWQDSDTAQFINFEDEKAKAIAINKTLSKLPDEGITSDFKNENNRVLTIENPNGINVLKLDPNIIQAKDTEIKIKGFVEGQVGTVIINVDLKDLKEDSNGNKEFTIPGSRFFYADGTEAPTGEVTSWQDGNVIWNIYDSSKPDGVYTGSICNSKVMAGIILAPGATVNLDQNFNGTVIANIINVNAESHRTDFTGHSVIPTSINFTKKWIGNPAPQIELKVYKCDEEGNKIEPPVRTVTLPPTKPGEGASQKEIDKYNEIMKNIDMNENGTWSYVFEGLAKYEGKYDWLNSKNNKEIKYVVEETPIDGYISSGVGDKDNNYTITNTENTTLTLSKKVTGNVGDREKAFKFEIVLKDKDGNPISGEKSVEGKSIIDGVKAPDITSITFDDTGKATVSLKHGQQIIIKGLPKGYSYTITELDADDYGASINGVADEDKTIEQSSEDGNAVSYENHKEIVPTGIRIDMMPYILIMLAAAAAGILWITKRKMHNA